MSDGQTAPNVFLDFFIKIVIGICRPTPKLTFLLKNIQESTVRL